MAILPVRIYGDPVLREPCVKVETIDGDILVLVKNMHATVQKHKGLGLSAPQVGLHKRLFVVDTTEFEQNGISAALINPEITGTFGEAIYEEGCLSFPGIYIDVRRPRNVGVRFTDDQGREQNREVDGVLARVVLHEFDHLDGKLFIDLLTEDDRQKIETLMQRKGIIPAQS